MSKTNLLRHMSNEHLISSLMARRDELSETEKELIGRMETLLDEQEESKPIVELLIKQDITSPTSWKNCYVNASIEFLALALDAGDLFTRLNDLVSTHQE